MPFFMARKKRNSASRKIYFYLTMAFFGIALLVFFIHGPRGTIQFYRAHEEKKQLEADIQTLEEQNKELQEEKDRLTSDPAYIEKTAREKYMMKKEGEKVYKVQHKKE
jgi:cell division protein FtsB